jgi:hypothetical protein
MRRFQNLLAALAVSANTAFFSESVIAAQNTDPTWPCVQRKVPSLSLGQVWNGPELPSTAANWQKDAIVSDLVRSLAARRMPVAEAEEAIRSFAKGLSGAERQERMAMLAQGLFDHMNAERGNVISGIARYAKNQLALAARLRLAASKLGELRLKPDADANDIVTRTEQMALETRIFEERVKALTYVCEVPTLIEQRLYTLSKAAAKEMSGAQ